MNAADQSSMVLTMDPDVKRVAEFMQCNFPANQLQGLAHALGQLAPVLWSRYGQSIVHPLNLNDPPISGCVANYLQKGRD